MKKRLTTNINGEYYATEKEFDVAGIHVEMMSSPIENACITKLGRLEDIEEELGVELETLYKAIKNGVWFQDDTNSIVLINPINIEHYIPELSCFDFENKSVWVSGDTAHIELFFKDYGKTWALTEEELLETKK